MNLAPYQAALALPGVRSLMLIALVARIPSTMTAVTLTFYVVFQLDRGYGAAGLVAAALTVGSALGGPLLGRLVDRRGLRTMLVLATVGTGLFWSGAQAMPYPVLLGTALLGGLVTLPVFGVVRQSLAALVPEAHRRPAYALDSMAVELSYMAGPALAVLLATSGSPRVAMVAVGVGLVLAGLLLFVLDPPVRAGHEPLAAARPASRREWLTPRLVGLLAATSATTLVLAGTDVAVVAAHRPGRLDRAAAGTLGLLLAGRRLRLRCRTSTAATGTAGAAARALHRTGRTGRRAVVAARPRARTGRAALRAVARGVRGRGEPARPRRRPG